MQGHGAGTEFRTGMYAALALVAFAANSILCRLALQRTVIDPASFSTIRLTSGALTLLLVAARKQGTALPEVGSWASAGMLALYAVPFSFAYVKLSAGTGALILFGSVQATMIVAALLFGERLRPSQWLGLCLAGAGLVFLVLPGLSAPPLVPAGFMGLAGFSWGAYSLLGRNARHPLEQTTRNFLRAVPFVLVVSAFEFGHVHVEPAGILLAAASGILASALGYVIWYAALGGLTATRAAVVQLAVPVLAAAGGIVFLGEALSARLIISAVAILGGIAYAISP
jgi:drug/metabolite transporter (DMT)-like permease